MHLTLLPLAFTLVSLLVASSAYVPTERPYFPQPNSALVQNEQIYYHREPETAAKWRKW